MKVNYKKVRIFDPVVFPEYKTPGANGFDLAASRGGVVRAKESATFLTNLAFEIPQDHVMLVFSRSGLGFNHGLRLCNCVGVIDSDYRGEIAVKLVNDSGTDYQVMDGDRIAQAVILYAPQFELFHVEELSETLRGAQGFGSTGA